jgi:hypothetical protein
MVNGTPDIFDSRQLVHDEDTEDPDFDDKEEQDFWNELADNCEEDPRYGITCVREDAFTNYAQNFAEDVGYWPLQNVTSGWPYDYITVNWEAAAEALKEDYAELTFRGETYYCR